MRFNEFIMPKQTLQNVFAKTGTNKFLKQQTSQEIRTPHWEMREAMALIETTPEISAGLNQMTKFIIGNNIEASSSDERSSDFLNKWINQRKGINAEVEKLVFLGIGLGNAFMERVYTIDSNGKKVLDNFFIHPDSSRIYINSQCTDENNNYWLYEVPREAISWREWSPNIYHINYMHGSYYVRHTIYGVGVPKSHFQHLKLGWSRDGWYGRGLINPAIDNLKILKETLNNIEKIVKHRALGTKIITPSSEDMEIFEDDVEIIEQKLLNKRPEDHLVLNKALKIESLSNLNEYDTMTAEIEYLRKSSGSSLVPNYMTPWVDSTYHNASEAKIPFQLQLDYYESIFVDFLNETIIKELRKVYPWLAEDLSFKFGSVCLESFETKAQSAPQLWQSGVITFNEFRKSMGYDTVENGDIWAWEMESKADTLLGDVGKSGGKSQAKPMTAKISEQYYTVPSFKKPRTRVCTNCESYMPKKRYCKKHNWPVEGGDGCVDFKRRLTNEDEN